LLKGCSHLCYLIEAMPKEIDGMAYAYQAPSPESDGAGKRPVSILRAYACGLLSMLILIVAFDEARGAEPMKKGMARVNGTDLYYEVMGKGSPLVLLSGGGTLDRRAWDDQFEAFAKHYKVIRYDIRGIGKSARPLEAFSHSRDLYALLKFLKVKKAHIVGLSFSGAIAIDFALEHPEMVDHLILAATGTSSDAKSKANLDGVLMLSAMAKKEGLARMIQFVVDLPFFISQENSAARERVRRIYLDNRDLFEADFPLVRLWQPTEPPASERLPEIHARALIILGENDHPSYKAITDKLASGIGGARKVMIPGGTHLLHMDKPKEFNEAVLEFLSNKYFQPSLRD
jgi:pimeloyl-ACP methyl ester carboxylesterase